MTRPTPLSPKAPLLAAALLTAAALGGLALAPRARAQSPTDQARVAFERGVSEMNAGRPQVASQYFQRSYQLSPRASSACNMALSLERSGRRCEAMQWYRQCAALDQAGRFRDHANRQAAALSNQCGPSGGGAPNPFVGGPGGGSSGAAAGGGSGGGPGSGGGVQIVESGGPVGGSTMRRREPGHGFLAVGIVGLTLGAGALAGSIGTGVLSNDRFEEIVAAPGTAEMPAVLLANSPDAQAFHDAETLRNVSIGLAVGAGLLGALGVVFVIVDLAQPGVLGPSARARGPSLALRARAEGGAEAALRLPL